MHSPLHVHPSLFKESNNVAYTIKKCLMIIMQKYNHLAISYNYITI